MKTTVHKSIHKILTKICEKKCHTAENYLSIEFDIAMQMCKIHSEFDITGGHHNFKLMAVGRPARSR